MKLTIPQVNVLDEAAFVARFGAVFEHSPWVARDAWKAAHPFRDPAHLTAAMQAAVRRADAAAQLALIRAHPDLVGRAAREGTLAPASASEQAGAGLDRLDPAEAAWFQEQNDAYRARFGFPFIICVRANRKEAIRAGFLARQNHSAEAEMRTALDEIDRIAAFRLGDLVEA